MSSHVSSGLRRILEQPFVYNTFKKIVGYHDQRQQRANELFRPFSGAKILDIGCGTAMIIEYLPKDIEYIGFDMNERYIEYAKQKYNKRGKFFCEKIGINTHQDWHEYFDIIIANGVIHHLTNSETQSLFETAYYYLKNTGRFITKDSSYYENQSSIEQFLISLDRGQNIRTTDEYLKLAKSFFPIVEPLLKTKVMRIPYNHFIMTCKKTV